MIVWMIEDGKAVRYRRRGLCRACGDCCGRHIVFRWTTAKGTEAARDEVGQEDPDYWKDWEGYSIIREHGLWWYFIVDEISDGKTVCGSLCDNRCMIHDDPAKRSAICHFWPFQIDSMGDFPNCGFWFELYPE